jgi:hypothetical protein
MGKNSKSPRPQGQIKKFIGPYQITWTESDNVLEEDVSIAGEEKTFLNYFITTPDDINDLLLERIAYWQNKQ